MALRQNNFGLVGVGTSGGQGGSHLVVAESNDFLSSVSGSESLNNFAFTGLGSGQLIEEQSNQNSYLNLLGVNYLENAAGVLNFNYVPEKIAQPIYTTGSETFGVIGHIDAFSTQFFNARRGILDLRTEITSTEDSLIREIGDYIEALYDDDSNEAAELNQFFGDYYNGSSFVVPNLTDIVNPGDSVSGSSELENDQTALFATGRVMRDDIRITQRLRLAIVRFRKFQQKRLNNIQNKLVTTEKEIVDAHKTLANLNRKRLESASDYQVVRHLATENWVKVESEYVERARILNNHKGLFFARVRETALNAAPPDPLPLRFANPDDLVPGCPLEDNDLPEELEPFMESVLDIAMTDWKVLRAHYRLLPTRRRLNNLLSRRRYRLDYRVNASYSFNNAALALRLGGLQVQNQALVRDVSRRAFPEAQSLAGYQWSSAQLLSLEDLLNGSPHRLRGYAENLRNKLDQASHCLLSELRNIKPSIRLDWSQAAEDDTLAVDAPERWPGLDRAEEEDFNGVRTLIELVQWWFRQLVPQADSTSYSAVRNLIRASLMIAASDDPEEILHGQLQTVPPQFKLGDALRLTLNREALPGTRLQLMDTTNQLVASLVVEDHDNDGAVATLTHLHNNQAVPATNYTVTGFILPGSPR